MAPESKFKPILLEELRDVIASGELMSIIMTDEELFMQMNNCLPLEDRISYRTFQRYKAYAMRYGMEDAPKDFDPMYGELYLIIRSAQIQQKRTLMHNLMNGTMQDFHKYKWIMERKFPDFNLGQINRKAEAEAKEFEAMQKEEIEQEKLKANPPEEPVVDEFQEWVDATWGNFLKTDYLAAKHKEAQGTCNEPRDIVPAISQADA